MNAKPWWQSRTLWWNIVSLTVVIGGTLADPTLVADPRVVAGATIVVTVGNAILRFLTSQPIAGTDAAKQEATP